MALFENSDFFMLVGGVKKDGEGGGGGGGGGGSGGVESNPGGTSETVETLLVSVALPNVPEKLGAINNNKLFVKDG